MKRVTLAEAAQVLGITQEEVRARIQRHELVACQTPGHLEFVWVRESTIQLIVGDSEEAKQALPNVEEAPAEETGAPFPSEAIDDLKQQIADLQKRVEFLEKLIVESPPNREASQLRLKGSRQVASFSSKKGKQRRVDRNGFHH